MRVPRRYLLLTAVLGIAVAVLAPVAVSETSPTVEAVNQGLYRHYWSPSQSSVVAGGVVTLRNQTTVAHGVEWVGGPAAPACSSGVPVGNTPAASGQEWSGTCTFAQAGTYTFYCTVHGPEMTGTITVSIPGAPAASTGMATAVDETEATLNGTVNPNGKATTYFFNYGTSASYGAKTSEESAGAGSADQSVSLPVSSLSPGTTYHFQLGAKNAASTTLGGDQTFTTATPPGPPSATTGSGTAVRETEATLNGTVNPDGESTKYFFQWGASNTYGQTTPELPAGEDHNGHVASTALTGLTAGTVYHFRLVAKNTSGTVSGLDRTFTTVSPLPPSSPATTTASTVTQSAAAPASTTVAMAPVEILPGSPLVGAPSFRSNQHGSSVHGSLDVSGSGANGRLEVDLLAKGASLARARGSGSGSVRVGRLVRVVPAGKVSFTVALDAKARHALASHRRLALTVKVLLTPKHGSAVTITRSVVLHA